MQLWYPLTLVDISHTLHSAGPPGSSVTTVPFWHFSPSLVYASLFSCLSVLPSCPLSGSMRFSLSQLSLWPEPYRCQSPWHWADRHPTPLLRQTEGGKKKQKRQRKMRERKDCVSLSSFSPPLGKIKFLYFFCLKRWCCFGVNEKTLLGANEAWKK